MNFTVEQKLSSNIKKRARRNLQTNASCSVPMASTAVENVQFSREGARTHTPELVLWVSASLEGAGQRIFCPLSHSLGYQQMTQV